jgi:lipopolysaccharide/colanic/teichoic acid biosynthesis glycosyltransferase
MAGLFDRVVAVVALIFLSPLLALIAVIVRLDSPGRAIYRQIRVGQGGAPFRILKFRTMVDGADRLGANVSPTGDPRITRPGRVLRTWYLDELPQLVNILKGDMRLVGPRPETPEYVAKYTEEERRVLSVKPGLVGPSTLGCMDEADQLAGADDPVDHYEAVLMHERVRLDLAYLETSSFTTDMRLLIQQALAIVVPRKRDNSGAADRRTNISIRSRPGRNT